LSGDSASVFSDVLGAGELFLFTPFRGNTSNAFKQLMRNRSVIFCGYKLVVKVFPKGEHKEKLMFLGRSVPLKLLSGVRQFPLGVLLCLWGAKEQQEKLSSPLFSSFKST